MTNLASVLQTQGRLAEAEPLHRRVLETSQRILGDEHPAVRDAERHDRFELFGNHPPKSAPDDTDLRAVADAWPTLPDALKTGILAMVRASGRSD